MSEAADTSLPKISRRSFLKSVGIAAGGALAVPAYRRFTEILGLPLETVAETGARVGLQLFLKELGTERGQAVLAKFATEANKKSNQIINEIQASNSIHKDYTESNWHLAPMDSIVAEAISGYKQNTGKDVVFRKMNGYRGLEYYIGILEAKQPELRNKYSWSDLLDRGKVTEINRVLTSELPTTLARIKRWSESNINVLEDFLLLLPPVSGMQERVAEKLGVETAYLYDGTQPQPSLMRSFREACLNEFISVAYDFESGFISKAVDRLLGGVPNSPPGVSASHLLEFFLKKADGRLDWALWDTAIYLKAFCRTKISTFRIDKDHVWVSDRALPPDPMNPIVVEIPDYETRRDVLEVVVHSFLDQYNLSSSFRELQSSPFAVESKFAFNFFEGVDKMNFPELNPVNRVGALYHSWNQVALLTAFPPEIAVLGVIKQQIATLSGEQGYAKLAADLFVSSRMKSLSGQLEAHKF